MLIIGIARIRRSNTVIAATIVLAVGYLSPCPSYPWEEDFHWGLTNVLAREAGFKEQFAKTIADENQEYDEGALTAPSLVFWYGCLFPENGAAKLTQERHFPSPSLVPTLPHERLVEPGSEYVRDALGAIARTGVGCQGKADCQHANLVHFGQILHAFQDSWSHTGEPDIPAIGWGAISCDEMRSMAHPAKRWGWDSHNADLTYLQEKDESGAIVQARDNVRLAMEAARETYNEMRSYLEKNFWAGSEKMPTPWDRLENTVRDFAIARTKAEKCTWFKNHGIPDCEFLDYINVPGRKPSDDLLQSIQSNAVHRPKERSQYIIQSADRDVSRPAIAFFDGFFRDWITNSLSASSEKLVGYLSIPSLAHELGLASKDMTAESNQVVKNQVLTAFNVWKIADHGLVNALGHGRDQRSIGVLGKELTSETKLIRPEAVSDALLRIAKSERYFDVIRFSYIERANKKDLSPRTAYAAIAKFKHAPNDTVVLVALPANDIQPRTGDEKTALAAEFRITSISHVIEH